MLNEGRVACLEINQNPLPLVMLVKGFLAIPFVVVAAPKGCSGSEKIEEQRFLARPQSVPVPTWAGEQEEEECQPARLAAGRQAVILFRPPRLAL
jgi:hypothetical protein